jgi:hypothetical protein
MTRIMAKQTARRQRVRRPRVIVPCSLRPEQAERLRQLSDQMDLPQAILIRQAVDLLLSGAATAGTR